MQPSLLPLAQLLPQAGEPITADLARHLILDGLALPNMRVTGSLDLSGRAIDTLPEGLRCHE